MKIVIENCKCPSWNDMQKKHWVMKSVDRDALIILACDAVRKQLKGSIRRIAEELKIPATVRIEAHFTHGNRRDPDNLYVKPVIDGIVKSGLLSDDNGKIIDWVALKAEVKMPSDKIIIYINE